MLNSNRFARTKLARKRMNALGGRGMYPAARSLPLLAVVVVVTLLSPPRAFGNRGLDPPLRSGPMEDSCRGESSESESESDTEEESASPSAEASGSGSSEREGGGVEVEMEEEASRGGRKVVFE